MSTHREFGEIHLYDAYIYMYTYALRVYKYMHMCIYSRVIWRTESCYSTSPMPEDPGIGEDALSCVRFAPSTYLGAESMYNNDS